MRPLPETVVLGGGCKWRWKLKQYMLVVDDYFSEQTSIGLAQRQTWASRSDSICSVSALTLTYCYKHR